MYNDTRHLGYKRTDAAEIMAELIRTEPQGGSSCQHTSWNQLPSELVRNTYQCKFCSLVRYKQP